MKQKRSRGLFEKTENGSVGNMLAQRENTFCPKALSENGSREKGERLAGGVPPVRFKTSNGARRRPKAAVVAGVEPWRGREIGGYQQVQGVLPRRWVVDLAVGEHHVDGDTFSGGRWFGRWWSTSVVAANSKLTRGSEEWMYQEATGKS